MFLLGLCHEDTFIILLNMEFCDGKKSESRAVEGITQFKLVSCCFSFAPHPAVVPRHKYCEGTNTHKIRRRMGPGDCSNGGYRKEVKNEPGRVLGFNYDFRKKVKSRFLRQRCFWV